MSVGLDSGVGDSSYLLRSRGVPWEFAYTVVITVFAPVGAVFPLCWVLL